MTPWQVLRSEILFKQVKANFSSVAWPGEIDIAPETLWLDSVPIQVATPAHELARFE